MTERPDSFEEARQRHADENPPPVEWAKYVDAVEASMGTSVEAPTGAEGFRKLFHEAAFSNRGDVPVVPVGSWGEWGTKYVPTARGSVGLILPEIAAREPEGSEKGAPSDPPEDDTESHGSEVDQNTDVAPSVNRGTPASRRELRIGLLLTLTAVTLGPALNILTAYYYPNAEIIVGSISVVVLLLGLFSSFHLYSAWQYRRTFFAQSRAMISDLEDLRRVLELHDASNVGKSSQVAIIRTLEQARTSRDQWLLLYEDDVRQSRRRRIFESDEELKYEYPRDYYRHQISALSSHVAWLQMWLNIGDPWSDVRNELIVPPAQSNPVD